MVDEVSHAYYTEIVVEYSYLSNNFLNVFA